MNIYIIIFIAVYFVLFFGFSVIWRNYAVYKETGINAFKLNSKEGPEAITGLYFKCLPLISILVFILYVFSPSTYQSLGPVSIFDYKLVQWVGVLFMSASLIWVIVAQSQMGASWRIGIDHDEATTFVQTGLFKYSRNPIFVGIILISFGYFLVLPNALTLTILVLDIALIQIQVSIEERFLKEAHGETYLQYCKHVRRWL